MSHAREVSWLFINHPAREVVAPKRPETPYEALMECPPGEEPLPSVEELAPMRELLATIIDDTLDERELWIFDALFIRRLSERQLASELSLSRIHIRRLRDGLRLKLQRALINQPLVREYLA